MATHKVSEELQGVLVFLGAIWAAFLLDWLLGGSLRQTFGLRPRTLTGLPGIAAMPFLHDGLRHLIGNTIPLFVLLALLAGSRAQSWAIVVEIVVVGGALLWLFGRGVTHVGASGLVFGLVAFLIVSGLLEGRLMALLVSILVAFLYGGTLLASILPIQGAHVSWDGHLCGAVAGVASAYTLRGKRQLAGPV